MSDDAVLLSVTAEHELIDRHLQGFLGALPVETGAPILVPTVRAILRKPLFALNFALPAWLGKRFGLSGQRLTELLLANTFHGLYFGLVDGLLDGHTQLSDAQTVRLSQLGALCTVLYGEGMCRYAAILPPDSSFWSGRLAYELEWAAAVSVETAPGALQCGSIDYTHAAHKGAPLKNTNAAIVHLCAMDDQVLGLLNRWVDSTMAAMILLDDAEDWREDLRQGRANQFSRFAATQAGSPVVSDAVVQSALLSTDVVEQYTRSVLRLIAEARDGLRELGIPAWDAFLAYLAAKVDATQAAHQALVAEYFREFLTGISGEGAS